MCALPTADAPPTPPVPSPFGGPLQERPKLSGDWLGARSCLRDHGITWDISSTNFYSGVATGGLEQTFRFRGRADYYINLDGEKLGLWKGFYVNLHGETVYGDSINGAVGSLMPVSIAQAVPQANGSITALTGVKFTQALSENFLVFAGKINTLDDFNQPFTGGARGTNGFMNTALLFNPVLVRTIPYSTFGTGFAVLKDSQPIFSFAVFDTTDSSTVSGFDTFFTNGASLVAQLNLPTKFFGLPGHQGIAGTYSSGQYTSIERSAFINPILSLTAPTTTGSWCLAYSFDQALYVDPNETLRSWGVFGNLGIADTNPSPFRWSANIGLGGSSPLPGRKQDTFGVGYYYLGLTDALKNLAPRLLPLQDEQGVELFYNVAVTPWCHVSPDLQIVVPAQQRADTALVLSLRAKLDF